MKFIAMLCVIFVFSCATIYNLKPTVKSVDESYGFSEANPIKVGGYKDERGPRNEREFLRHLKSYNQNMITDIYRAGSCCAFETKSGFMGGGLLDMYVVTTELDTITLFLNMYDYEVPKIPHGFN